MSSEPPRDDVPEPILVEESGPISAAPPAMTLLTISVRARLSEDGSGTVFAVDTKPVDSVSSGRLIPTNVGIQAQGGMFIPHSPPEDGDLAFVGMMWVSDEFLKLATGERNSILADWLLASWTNAPESSATDTEPPEELVVPTKGSETASSESKDQPDLRGLLEMDFSQVDQTILDRLYGKCILETQQRAGTTTVQTTQSKLEEAVSGALEESERARRKREHNDRYMELSELPPFGVGMSSGPLHEDPDPTQPEIE